MCSIRSRPERHRPAAVTRPARRVRRGPIGMTEIAGALAVRWNEGIDVDERRHPGRNAASNAGDDRGPRACAHQYYVVQVFLRHDFDHIRDVGHQPDVGMGEVGGLSEPGERRGVDLVSVRPELRSHLAPTPAAKQAGCTMAP
jgi:hypothetical protein